MEFINENHEKFYYEKMGQVIIDDCYTRSLIYLLSINHETQNYFDEIYNMKNNQINFECLSTAWQTSTSLNICRLAFNLFNNCASDNPDKEDCNIKYTVSSIFSVLGTKYYTYALKIRFN